MSIDLTSKTYLIGEISVYEDDKLLSSSYGNEHVENTIRNFTKVINGKHSLAKQNLISLKKTTGSANSLRHGLDIISIDRLTAKEELNIFTSLVNVLFINTLNSFWETESVHCDKEDFYAICEIKKLLAAKSNDCNSSLEYWFTSTVIKGEESEDYEYGENIMKYEDVSGFTSHEKKGYIDLSFSKNIFDQNENDNFAGRTVKVKLTVRAYRDVRYIVNIPIFIIENVPYTPEYFESGTTENTLRTMIANYINDFINYKSSYGSKKYNVAMVEEIMSSVSKRGNDNCTNLPMKDLSFIIYKEDSSSLTIYDVNKDILNTETCSAECLENALPVFSFILVSRILSDAIFDKVKFTFKNSYPLTLASIEQEKLDSFWVHLKYLIESRLKLEITNRDYNYNTLFKCHPTEIPTMQILVGENKKHNGPIDIDISVSQNIELPTFEDSWFKVVYNIVGQDLENIQIQFFLNELYYNKVNTVEYDNETFYKMIRDIKSSNMYISIREENILISSDSLFVSGTVLDNLVILYERLINLDS